MNHKIECTLDFLVGVCLCTFMIILLPVKWLDLYLIERRTK